MKLPVIVLLSFIYIALSPGNKSFGQLKPIAGEADEDKYAAPPESIARLFYLQRTPNANTIVYELNAKNGVLDEEEPVHVYWIKNAERGQKEELNYIQRKFAYGVVNKKLANDQYDVRFVSYKKFPLLLMKANDGKYHIFATIEQKQMMLSRIFLKIEGGSFWLPNIVYAELRGTDPATGREIVRRFKPDITHGREEVYIKFAGISKNV